MNDGEKMSKSLGNVIDPVQLVERFGADPVRYFMMNDVAFGGDGDFSDRKLADSVNSHLANALGNLAYRTLSFAYKHCDGAVPAPGDLTEADMLRESAALLAGARQDLDEVAMHRYTQ